MSLKSVAAGFALFVGLTGTAIADIPISNSSLLIA